MHISNADVGLRTCLSNKELGLETGANDGGGFYVSEQMLTDSV